MDDRLKALEPEPKTDPDESEFLPEAPQRVSRVDTLPESFIKLLQQRPLFIGDIIGGRYRLVQALGQGAMGQVFVAENLAIGRRVAVKVLKQELLADAIFRQRFQHEAEAFAAIEHRNVARFLDLVVGDPTFIVMEYVRGPTLEDRLNEDGQLAPSHAVAIARRLCWALDVAHQAGVVHRDIKPANVILCPDPEVGEEPKLIDFGLAKLANHNNQASLTRTGQIIGTPDYMAPEQIANREIDSRADIYALGCLLYHMVAGQPPFGGDDVQVLYAHMHQQPPPLQRFAPSVPPSLARTLERALKKDPDDRFQTMREMAHALSEVYDKVVGEDTDVAFDPATLSRPLPKSRWRRTAALTAAVGLLGAAGGTFWGRHHPPAAAIAKSGTALLIASRPAGAAIELDGKPYPDTTPTMIRDLSAGAHSIKLHKGALSAVERRVELRGGERTLVNVALPAAMHRLEVRSVPEGATIFLDGHLARGETPTTIEVGDQDFHELRIEKSGFETASRAITPEDDEPVITLSLTPEKQARGTLIVDSNIAAQVWIDGLDSGYTTPTLGLRVPAGEHTVEVRAGRNARASADVVVKKGETLRMLLSPGATTAAKSPTD